MEKDFITGLGIQIPDILLPNQQIDKTKWAVVACDQYTSQPKYWENVATLVGDAPSTLHIIYPEVYLGKEDGTKRIQNIQSRMREYLEKEILVSQGKNFIFVDRRTTHSLSRKGLIVALDLECYDYHKGSQTLTRATEGTVLDRIPPRVKIREKATVELPHIMILIDDPEQLVIEPVANQLPKLTQLYSVDLMMNGGHIDGYKIDDQEIVIRIFKGLQLLADKERYNQKYGLNKQAVLLYAVGDGNHSLATAKAVWEKIKQNCSGGKLVHHPARYALVELVNIHDPGIKFEPIHRVVFNVRKNEFFTAMNNYYRNHGAEFNYHHVDQAELLLMLRQLRANNDGAHIIDFVTETGPGIIVIRNPVQNLEVGSLQSFLDDYTSQHQQVEVDYIHGKDVVTELGSKANNIGFYLPPMEKSALFKTVIIDGVLPRKTFSMGEAEEKRFYMECRKLI